MASRAAKGIGSSSVLEDLQPLLDLFIDMGRQRLGSDLVAVALFGSVARGNPRPESDIDLLTVHDGDRNRVHDALVEAALELRKTPQCARVRSQGLPSEPYPLLLSRGRLAETPWILLDVADHGIILFDPSAVLQLKLAALRARLRELGSRKVEMPDGSWYWELKPDLRPGEMFEL